MCQSHYDRMRRRGTTEALVRRDLSVTDRYWLKVRRRADDECWPWLAQITPEGYGGFRSPVGILAHRYGWTLAHGPIPDGLVLDHVCHDPTVCFHGRACPHRACQNPAHLRLVTPTENGAEGRRHSPNAAKTHCPVGHPFDEVNTRWQRRTDGRLFRQCRACAREKYHRRKGARSS